MIRNLSPFIVALVGCLGTASEAVCLPPSWCVCRGSQLVAEATLTATDGRITTARLAQVHGPVPDAGVPSEVQVDALPTDAPGLRVLVFLYGQVVDGGAQLQFKQTGVGRHPIGDDGKVLCESAESPVRMEISEAVSLALDPSCEALLTPRLGNPECNDTGGCACGGGTMPVSSAALAALFAFALRRRRQRHPY